MIKTEQARTKRTSTRSLPWPENLITDIGLAYVFEDETYRELTDDQMKGLLYVISMLRDRQKTVLRMRYQEKKTLREIAETLSLSPERVRQLVIRSFRILRHEPYRAYFRDGYTAVTDADRQKTDEEEKAKEKEKAGIRDAMPQLYKIGIGDSGLSTRTYNVLKRAGITTLGQAAEAIALNPKALFRVRNLGTKSFAELIGKLEEYGFECSMVKSEYGIC